MPSAKISVFPTTCDIQGCSQQLLQTPVQFDDEQLFLLRSRFNVFVVENCFNQRAAQVCVVICLPQIDAVFGLVFQTFDCCFDYLELGSGFADDILSRCQWFTAKAETANYRI